MRCAFAVPAEPRMIAELNITPLIDVVLVLLVMFIITLPMATHQVPLDMPHGKAGGALTLDGAGVVPAAIAARLGAIAREEDALVVLRTDPEARYDRFVHVTAAVRRTGITRLGSSGRSGLATLIRD